MTDLKEELEKLSAQSPQPSEVPIERYQDFRRDLQKLLNQHSMENGSGTPDFLLASYLTGCLMTFDLTLKERGRWILKGGEG